ncbi:hypothetical protein [Maritimibacter sp. UBA3975]|uniref:hypothetical protein n=1 Tax=Maritimibacter sp. UBA3975 TaxID=1946833 RepID=UPI0025BC30B4|nr:hypothetical protein [Maritimibacter sp. UBA3975]|tara:strand:- start:28487 stop:28663 length:177 start_codon:yes stop_codon:yes gene_type:complete
MAGMKIEEKALSLLRAFEGSGRPVSSIVIDGRKIEVVLRQSLHERDEFEGIDMRHGKT